MAKKKMENILAEELKRKFEQSPEPKFDRIYVSKRPYQAASLKKKWHDIYGNPTLIPPLQPEILIAVCRRMLVCS